MQAHRSARGVFVMLFTSVHLSLLISALFLSDVAAAPRFWSLTGVQFDDGTVATGYLSYDDATQTIASWNIQVDQRLVFSFPAFTYVPGNSQPYTFQVAVSAAPLLGLSAPPGFTLNGDASMLRTLQITPVAPLDGRNGTVPIVSHPFGSYVASREQFGEGDDGRSIIAGSLTLMSMPPSVAVVQVDEFYNAALQHYFMTASPAEKRDLDTGVHPGWARTGESFMAYASGSLADGSINPTCRYYGTPLKGLDSHFESADARECLSVFRKYPADWLLEADNVFQINLPDMATGACPRGTIPVYRVWNQRRDSNHRFTTNPAIRAQMLAAGYAAEGYGPNGVVMCALQ